MCRLFIAFSCIWSRSVLRVQSFRDEPPSSTLAEKHEHVRGFAQLSIIDALVPLKTLAKLVLVLNEAASSSPVSPRVHLPDIHLGQTFNDVGKDLLSRLGVFNEAACSCENELLKQARKWKKDEFNPNQNTVFVDVDDTIIAPGYNFIAGMDSVSNQNSRSIPKSHITGRHEVYPRVLEFINIISSGRLHKKHVARTGNLFVTTARPPILGSKVYKLCDRTLQHHQPDRLHRGPLGVLCGNLVCGAQFMKTETEAKACELLGMCPRPAEIRLKRQRFEALGDFKVATVRQQVWEIESSFPRYRPPGRFSRRGRHFFLGDNGQGDLHAGIKLLQERMVDYVFIHDVRNLRKIPVEDWAERDPEAAGVQMYRRMPDKLRKRVILFHNYEEAIGLAKSHAIHRSR